MFLFQWKPFLTFFLFNGHAKCSKVDPINNNNSIIKAWSLFISHKVINIQLDSYLIFIMRNLEAFVFITHLISFKIEERKLFLKKKRNVQFDQLIFNSRIVTIENVFITCLIIMIISFHLFLFIFFYLFLYWFSFFEKFIPFSFSFQSDWSIDLTRKSESLQFNGHQWSKLTWLYVIRDSWT